MKSFLCVFAMLLTFTARAETCASHFGDASGKFISYLEHLLDQQILDSEDLNEFAKSLEQTGVLTNPLAKNTTVGRMHARELDQYIRAGELSPALISDWAKKHLAESEKNSGDRNAIARIVHHRLPHFIKVEVPGLGYSIEIMDTPVTQSMWETTMGANPAHFKNGSAAKPDHPIESITWWSALVYANIFSRKQGLPQTYDLNGMKFTGSEEEGDLMGDSEAHKAIDRAIKSRNGGKGLEGYRLPTPSELVLIETNLAQASEDFRHHVWFDANAGGETHEVAALEPLRLGEEEIFDLWGNVREWTHNSSMEPEPLVSAYGGGWNSPNKDLARSIKYHSPNDRLPDVGFRLVRTLK